MSLSNVLPLEVWEAIWMRERNPQGFDAFSLMAKYLADIDKEKQQ